MPAMEVLGEHPGPRLPPRLVAVAAALLAVLAAGGWWWNASVEMQADLSLASAERDVRDRTESGEAGVLSTLAYASPLIWSASVSESVRSDLRALVEARAADVVRQLDEVRARVDATQVLPWHSAQEQARDGVLAQIDKQRQRFALIAADARGLAEAFAEE